MKRTPTVSDRPNKLSTRASGIAFRFVLTMGIVNLFADTTYEGGASINGPFLASLGAKIGWSAGDCAPAPSHTTGHAVLRIRRLNPAALTRRKIRWQEEAVAAKDRIGERTM